MRKVGLSAVTADNKFTAAIFEIISTDKSVTYWEVKDKWTNSVEPTEPRKGHFFSDIYQKRNWNKEIRTEIKTKNISFNRLILSFKRYNKSLKRYKIEWKLKQEKQNGN